MTANSLICNFINNNPNDWAEKLEAKNIKVKKDGNFAIFNYGVTADFSDPIVQEARGIIIHLPNLDVTCWPFRKFGNYGESYADKIDWSTARVQDKLDGSIVKLWWNFEKEEWQWSTNGVINAKDAPSNSPRFSNYLEIIKSCENYDKISTDTLGLFNAYIFELVSPDNQIVIRYPTSTLWHIGTRDNMTGEEFNCDIGIHKPHEYQLYSLQDCIKAAEILNEKDKVIKEGFVVVDDYYNRIKVKSPQYLVMHRLYDRFSKVDIIEMIKISGIEETYKMIESFPGQAHIIFYYLYKYYELIDAIDLFMNYTRNLYEEYSNDRRAVANIIKNKKFSIFGFMALDNKELDGMSVINKATTKKIAEFIPDYKPINFLEERNAQ